MAKFTTKTYNKADGSSLTISFKEAKYKRATKIYKKLFIGSVVLNLVLISIIFNNLLRGL